jgi:hypothetical protein
MLDLRMLGALVLVVAALLVRTAVRPPAIAVVASSVRLGRSGSRLPRNRGHRYARVAVVLETVVVIAVAAIVVAAVVCSPIVVVALVAAPIVSVAIVTAPIVAAVPVAPVVPAAVAAAVVTVPVSASVVALVGENRRSGKRCCGQDGHAETAHVCLLVDCKR